MWVAASGGVLSVRSVPAEAGEPGLTPGGRDPGGGTATAPVFSPVNPVDRGAPRAAVHGLTQKTDTTVRKGSCLWRAKHGTGAGTSRSFETNLKEILDPLNYAGV